VRGRERSSVLANIGWSRKAFLKTRHLERDLKFRPSQTAL
jgi:hypothetical protein